MGVGAGHIKMGVLLLFILIQMTQIQKNPVFIL